MSNQDEDNDYKVGYGRPPRHTRFQPGNRANPRGRAGSKAKKSAPALESEAAILERLEAELVDFQGRKITKREAKLRVVQAKALKGDSKAADLLERVRSKGASEKPATGGGVLFLPSAVPINEWEASAAIQQAQFRGDPVVTDKVVLANSAKGEADESG